MQLKKLFAQAIIIKHTKTIFIINFAQKVIKRVVLTNLNILINKKVKIDNYNDKLLFKNNIKLAINIED